MYMYDNAGEFVDVDVTDTVDFDSSMDGDHYDFNYPIIWIFEEADPELSPNGSIARNTVHLVGHSGMFLFNAANVVAIMLVHGFIFGTLGKNILLKLASLVCFFQMFGSVASIHRYNINDEYGYWAHVSNGLGLVAYALCNIVVQFIFWNRDKRYRKVCTLLWIGLAIGTWCISRIRWNTKAFYYIRGFSALSVAHQLAAYALVLEAFSKGSIGLPQDFPLSKKVVQKSLVACIALLLLAMGFCASGHPIFVYPAEGLTFSVMVWVVSLVGEMDFMDDYKAMAASGKEIYYYAHEDNNKAAPIVANEQTRLAIPPAYY